MTGGRARAYMSDYRIPVTDNFFTLTPKDIENVLKAAEEHKYKRPKNSNGSKARNFHKLLMQMRCLE